MAECAYCSWRFAEARSDDHTLVILDRNMPGVEERADELKVIWRDAGIFDRMPVIDRRIRLGSEDGPKRRHYDKRMIFQ